MKKFISTPLSILCFFAYFVASCTSEEDTRPRNNAYVSLEGEWKCDWSNHSQYDGMVISVDAQEWDGTVVESNSSYDPIGKVIWRSIFRIRKDSLNLSDYRSSNFLPYNAEVTVLEPDRIWITSGRSQQLWIGNY